MVTRKQIAADLRKLGIRRGDILEVHSSLKAVGRVQGGPKAVIRAFQVLIGTSGTLLMPVLSYCYTQLREVFAHATSPSKVGLITETFRTMPGVVRSCCPTHSVAAWGRRAVELTMHHALTAPIGVGSPLHLAALAGGKVVLLGCTQKTNSFLHVVEALTGHPAYLDTPIYGDTAQIRMPDGMIKTVQTRSQTGDSRNFIALEPFLERSGLIAHGLVGAAPTQVMVGQAVIDCLVPILKKRPELPLCKPGTCNSCDLRHAVIQEEAAKSKGTTKAGKGRAGNKG